MISSVSPQQAAAELLRRDRAAESLIDFANAVDIPGRPAVDDPNGWLFEPVETTLAAHHLLLLRRLEDVAHGRIRRLMVFMPPGSAKSTYTSVVFPTWYMGFKPESRIILASYATEIARKQGRRARQIVRSESYRPIFETTVSDETSAADNWALSNGSEYMAGGILSGVTGNRAHGVIIDDPVAGREEADSETIQKKTRDAYDDDLRTRLVPGGWEIIVQTRWNERDLAGTILPEDWDGESGDIPCRDGSTWHVLCLPAIANRDDDPLGRRRGERLWPEWFTAEHFAVYQQQSRTWNALFQQRPQDAQGGYFKRAWFKVVHHNRVPRLVDAVRSWDLAATAADESADPDWLVGCKMARGEDGRYYVLDVVRERVSANEVEQVIKNTAGMDGGACKIRLEQEGAASGKIVAWNFTRMLAAYDVRFTGIPTKSKAVRADPYNAACERGDVFLAAGDWNTDFVNEHARFPTAAHDDQVDAAANAYQTLAGDPKPWDREALHTVFAGSRWSQPRPKTPQELLMEKLTGGRN